MIEINNEKEKTYLRLLIRSIGENNHISFDEYAEKKTDILNNRAIEKNEEGSQLVFYHDKEENVIEVVADFLCFIMLFKMLEKENLIFLYGKTYSGEFKSKNLDKSNLSDSITDEYFDNLSIELIQDIWNKIIFVRSDLIEYVKNDFVTPEQKKHEEQMDKAEKQLEKAQQQIQEAKRQVKWTIGAFIISLITFIISFIH